MYRPLELRAKNFISYEELIYKFPQKPVLLIGQNKDDSSQMRNGSGKSALIEAIPIAILGESLRDVKVKELIRRGELSAEIEIDLYNRKIGKILSIKRTLYAKKTSKVEVKFGQQEIRLSSVAEYDAYILKILEITKEDFFNFFVIKKDSYTPFLSTTDSKKKAIINRFSKADVIDKTKPLIDQTIAVFENDIKNLELQEAYHNGQIILLSDQLAQKSPGKRIEILKDDIDLVQSQIDKCRVFIKDSIPFQSEIKGSISLKLLGVESEKKSISDLEIELDRYKIVYENTGTQYDTTLNDLNNLRKEQSNDLSVYQNSVESIRKELNENKSFRSLIEGQLSESIVCPSCRHEFVLRDEQFNTSEAKEILNEDVIPLIQSLENRLKESESNLILKQTEHKLSNTTIENLLLSVQIKLKESGNEVRSATARKLNTETTLEYLTKEYNKLHSQLTENIQDNVLAEEKIVKLQSTLNQHLNAIDLIKEDNEEDPDQIKLNTLTSDSEKILSKIESKKKELGDERIWITHFKNFKSFLANQSIANIQSYTNMYLQKMDSNLCIEMDGYRTLADGSLKEEISVMVWRDENNSGSYGTFSAGERARIDVACIMAIQHLINLSCQEGGLDLLICDEILDAADALGIQKIIESISDSSAVIMIVSQNEVVSDIANIITAIKEKGITSLSYNY